MKIFLDDIRIPRQVYSYIKNDIYLHFDWIVVRSYEEFVKYIEQVDLNQVEVISFDHDLADSHYEAVNQSGIIDYDLMQEKTGYDCAKWICEYCFEYKIKLPNYLVHSMNPVGGMNIKKYLENYKKL